MSGNTYGKLFTVTTAGESHGPALVAIVDGCPPGLELSLDDLQRDLDRHKPGTSRHTTQRQEADEVEILSGVFEGRTTGCPIGLLIRNTDQKSKDYSAIKDLFRPAHADYTYHHKYGLRDYRGGGRSSARETAMRVAAGAIAKKYLATLGIQVRGYMSQLGPIEIPFKTWDSVEQNAFSVRTRTRCRSWRPTWTSCAVTRIRWAQRSPWSPRVCRRASVSRSSTAWTRSLPTR